MLLSNPNVLFKSAFIFNLSSLSLLLLRLLLLLWLLLDVDIHWLTNRCACHLLESMRQSLHGCVPLESRWQLTCLNVSTWLDYLLVVHSWQSLLQNVSPLSNDLCTTGVMTHLSHGLSRSITELLHSLSTRN